MISWRRIEPATTQCKLNTQTTTPPLPWISSLRSVKAPHFVGGTAGFHTGIVGIENKLWFIGHFNNLIGHSRNRIFTFL